MKTLLHEEFLSEEELCEWLGIAVPTARSNAARRKGPPRIRVGQRIFYRKSAVLAWLLEHERQPVTSGR
ncbi:MAG: helix-turn-helix domain-containing protein [Alphaproteobacteria bacterium]|nr:helix-turn-helix domain-containing protein [Alphaproteobacteria bacterium]